MLAPQFEMLKPRAMFRSQAHVRLAGLPWLRQRLRHEGQLVSGHRCDGEQHQQREQQRHHPQQRHLPRANPSKFHRTRF